jgi:hypothetical protein
MATKTAGKSVPSKKENGKKNPPPIQEKLETQQEVELSPVDPDEIEEQEDAAAASASQGGNAAALAAAAGGTTEMSASFKNFRHHPDMENFYRFIYENDLRHEALAIIDEIMAEKLQRRMIKGSKAQPH